jgi:hypothetical protein
LGEGVCAALFLVRMKTLLRLSIVGLFLGVIAFCVFGFVTTFEPMPSFTRTIWRTAYLMIGAACVCGIIRPLRCQLHQWIKRPAGRL